jgi:hypothetical protein
MSVTRAPDRPHSKFEHVYPIVRVDLPFDEAYPTNTVAVVKVLATQEEAEAEVARLNKLGGDKACTYFFCTSRLIEQSTNADLAD